MSIDTTTPSHTSVPDIPDVAFDRRWATWKARGLARERRDRRRFLIVAIVIVVIAAGVLVAYGLLAP